MSKVEREKFKKFSNKERAEAYAEIKPHDTYTTEGPSLLKWIHNWRFRSIKNLIGNTSNKTVLDAGSGEGYFLSQIKAKEKYGIEMSEKRVKRSLQFFPNLRVIVGDVRNIPFEDKSLDVIVCSEVLEHVDGYEKALQEFKRCIKPSGGIIVVSFPNEQTIGLGRLLIMKFPIHEIDHVNWITPRDVENVMGMKPVVSNVPPFLYPLCLYQVYKFQT
ncbi:MAG: class I SAM-dependent methyltransferase [Nitrosotalea sp.]